MQLNQQNLKSGKAEVSIESAKEKQLLKEEHGKRRSKSEQAADSADHEKWGKQKREQSQRKQLLKGSLGKGEGAGERRSRDRTSIRINRP